jgi:pimeloyl-ACP methyl ester carboxylesterase
MLFYKRYQRTTHPTIFIHGFLGSHKEALNLLHSETISWHLIDLPGHGSSKSDTSINDLMNYLDSLGSPFHLVGYSLGGRVAQFLSHHKNCLSLSLISSHTLFDEKTLQERIIFEDNLKLDLVSHGLERFVQNFYESSLFSSLKRRKRVFESMMIRREGLFLDDLLFALDELSVKKIKSNLPNCPILGLYGMLDRKYQKIYTCLPEQVHVVSIPNSGHAIHLENPKRCLEILETFLYKVENDLANLRTLS